jgi:hypothetical protein
MVGVDRKKMRLFDLEESAQAGINDVVDGGKRVKKSESAYDDTPAFDKSTDNKFQKKDFGNFNFN